MSGRVYEPSEVQAEQVAQHWLRHEGQVPRLSPEVDRDDRRNDEAEENFQGNEEPAEETKELINVILLAFVIWVS